LTAAVAAKMKEGLPLKKAIKAVAKNKRVMADARAVANAEEPVPVPVRPPETVQPQVVPADSAERRYLTAICELGYGEFHRLGISELADVAGLVPARKYVNFETWSRERNPQES